jgi:putative ABC transport system permease protein
MKVSFQLLQIAFKIFKRDYKRGDLLVLLFSMIIAMASVSVIYLVIDRIETASEREISEILGADLAITSPKPINPQWLQLANQKELTSATSVEFSTVLFANENMQLSSIKAVSDGYPLRGSLQISKTPEVNGEAVNIRPKRGEFWLEPRIYHKLGLSELAQNKQPLSVEVGYTNLTVSGVIKRKPGQGSTLFNIAPTAIINIDDLDATQIIQPGSRVNYRYLLTGSAQNLKDFVKQIKPQLNSAQNLTSIYDESPVAGGALVRSKKFIGLSSLLTLILLGVAIAMSASRYAKKQFDMSALMRCFGLTNNQVLQLFVFILIFVAIAGVIIGGVIGVIFQEILILQLSEFFVEALPPADYSSLLLPMLAALILLFGFALPSLVQIKSIPPMRVLRRQLAPMYFNRWLTYGLASVSLTFVMWLQMGDLKLLLTVLLGLAAVTLVFSLLAGLILKMIKSAASSKSASVNFSLRQLDANKGITLLHLLAFSITLFVIALVILVRTELLTKWQQSLGDDIPNHFMVNLKASDVAPLENLFESKNLSFSELYPMVRGRIVGINGEDIKTAVSEQGQKHNSLQRELNMTWSADLPTGNKVVEGQWRWPVQSNSDSDSDSDSDSESQLESKSGSGISTASQSQALISIEDKTAEALDLELGDVLDFKIGAEDWHAKIVNIRSIDWQTFTPNFYIIANPGGLTDFDATYITSFFLPSEQKPLLAQIVKDYPAVTVIEMDVILAEIQSIIAKISQAIEAIMIFVVIAGIALLWAAMEHTFEAKYKQSAILRTLGASKKFIAASFRFEYIWLALLASTMAVFAVELISYILYRQIFEIPFEMHWGLWWSMPLATLSLMLLASWRGVKKVTEPSPLLLIRGN